MERNRNRNIQIFAEQDVIQAELYGVSPDMTKASVRLGAYVSVKASKAEFIGYLVRLEISDTNGVDELLATFNTQYGNLTINAEDIVSIEVL